MSGAQTSGFPNVLFNAPAAYNAAQQYQDNQLLMQQHQQAVTDHDIAAVGQAAAPLLGMSEDDAAKAYPGWLQDQQSRGIAKYAPQSYPGHAAVQALVQRAMPLMDQFKLGYITPSGTQAAIDAALRPGSTPPTAQASSGAPATSGTVEPDALTRAQAVRDGLIKRGLDVDTATGFAANALHESGANPNVGAGDAGASHGTFQWNADRLARYQAINGHPPDNAPLDEQLDFVIHELNTTEGAARDRINAAQGPAGKAAAISQFYLRPKDVVPEMQRRSGTATQLATQWGGAGTSTAAPVITGDSLASQGGLGGSGVVGDSPAKVLARVQAESRAGKYSGQPVVLSTGASNNPTDLASVEQQIREAQGGNAGNITVLGVGPAVEAKAPGTNAKLQALATSYGAQFVPLPTDQMSPDGVHPTAQGYATLKAAIAPPQGAPGGVAARTGGTDVAGPGAGPGGAPGADLVGPRVLPPIGPGSPVVTPQSLANTPTPQPQAQVPQPPANRVMPGSPDGPPAPTPPPAQQQPPPGARANLPRAADIPTGVNSQQYRDAADLQRRALILEAQVDPTGRLKQLAGGLRQQAQLLLQTDSVVQTQEGQLHPLTGQIGDPTKPLPHYVYDPTQHAYIDTTGTNKPEFEPAQRDSAVAQRDVMELGPKVANGTATPQEQARYATAVETYRQPVLRENPVTKETVRVNTRELPAGFPEPTGLRGTGAPGGAGASGGSNVVIPGYSPQQQEIERNKGRYDIAADDLKHDRGEIAAIGDAGRSAQQDNLRVQEMRDILTNANTGPGTETAAHLRAWVARWTPGQLAAWDGSGANLSNPAAIEMFQKLGFVGAVTQERGSTPRGGYQATKMFQQFNPGAQLLTSTNQGLLAQRLIANQAEADYAQAAQDHYNTQRERLKSPEQNYDPLSSFDAKWQAQRNPQVYAAAIGALGGQDGEMWSRGLSKDEIQRVKDVVARADPKAVVNMPGDAPTGRNRPPLTSFQR